MRILSVVLASIIWLPHTPLGIYISQFAGCQLPPGFDSFSPTALRSALSVVIKDPKVRAVIWVVSSADKFPSLAERIRSEVGASIGVIHVTYEHIGHNIHFLSRAKGVILDGEYLQSLSDEARQYLIRTISDLPKEIVRQFIC
jgi:hypothetical protein